MMIYVGNGGFIPGVPARDLTDEEVKRWGKQLLLNSGLYVEKKAVNPSASNKMANPETENKGA